MGTTTTSQSLLGPGNSAHMAHIDKNIEKQKESGGVSRASEFVDTISNPLCGCSPNEATSLSLTPAPRSNKQTEAENIG